MSEQEVTQEEVFQYLEELRDSGVTNMFGAAVYLQDEFGFDKAEAREWVTKWMRSFDKGNNE